MPRKKKPQGDPEDRPIIKAWLDERDPERVETEIWDAHNGRVPYGTSDDVVSAIRRFRNTVSGNPAELIRFANGER